MADKRLKAELAGEEIWKNPDFPEGPYGNGHGTYVDGVSYIGYEDTLAAVEIATETVLWTYSRDGSYDFRGISADSGLVVVNWYGESDPDAVVAHDPADGSVVWEFTADVYGAFTSVAVTDQYVSILNIRYDDDTYEHAVLDRNGNQLRDGTIRPWSQRIFAGANDIIYAVDQEPESEATVIKFDVAANTELWSTTVPLTTYEDTGYVSGGAGIEVGTDTIALSTADSIHGFDRSTGEYLWESNGDGGIAYFEPADAYLCGTFDELLAVRAADGEFIYSVSTYVDKYLATPLSVTPGGIVAGRLEPAGFDAEASGWAAVTVGEADPALLQVDSLTKTWPVYIDGDESVEVDAAIANAGDFEDTQTITASISNDAATDHLTVPARSTKSISFALSPSEPGEKTLSVTSEDDTASTTFSADAAEFILTLDSVTSPVNLETGEQLQVDATVENVGDFDDVQTVSASIPNDTSGEAVSIPFGETDSVSLTLSPSGPGEKTLSVTSEDDTASTTFTAEVAEFGVAIENTNSPVDGSDDGLAKVTVTVSNAGNVAGTRETTLTLPDDSAANTLTLAAGGSETLTLTANPETAGEQTASVSAGAAAASTTIDVIGANTDIVILDINGPLDANGVVEVDVEVTNAGGVTSSEELELTIEEQT